MTNPFGPTISCLEGEFPAAVVSPDATALPSPLAVTTATPPTVTDNSMVAKSSSARSSDQPTPSPSPLPPPSPRAAATTTLAASSSGSMLAMSSCAVSSVSSAPPKAEEKVTGSIFGNLINWGYKARNQVQGVIVSISTTLLGDPPPTTRIEQTRNAFASQDQKFEPPATYQNFCTALTLFEQISSYSNLAPDQQFAFSLAKVAKKYEPIEKALKNYNAIVIKARGLARTKLSDLLGSQLIGLAKKHEAALEELKESVPAVINATEECSADKISAIAQTTEETIKNKAENDLKRFASFKDAAVKLSELLNQNRNKREQLSREIQLPAHSQISASAQQSIKEDLENITGWSLIPLAANPDNIQADINIYNSELTACQKAVQVFQHYASKKQEAINAVQQDASKKSTAIKTFQQAELKAQAAAINTIQSSWPELLLAAARIESSYQTIQQQLALARENAQKLASVERRLLEETAKNQQQQFPPVPPLQQAILPAPPPPSKQPAPASKQPAPAPQLPIFPLPSPSPSAAPSPTLSDLSSTCAPISPVDSITPSPAPLTSVDLTANAVKKRPRHWYSRFLGFLAWCDKHPIWAIVFFSLFTAAAVACGYFLIPMAMAAFAIEILALAFNAICWFGTVFCGFMALAIFANQVYRCIYPSAPPSKQQPLELKSEQKPDPQQPEASTSNNARADNAPTATAKSSQESKVAPLSRKHRVPVRDQQLSNAKLNFMGKSVSSQQAPTPGPPDLKVVNHISL